MPHPLARGFNRDVWEKAATEDDEDKNLQSSALAIADLIDVLRPHARTNTKNLAVLRALVALGNMQSKALHDQMADAATAHAGPIYIDELLNRKHPDTQGTLSELTDGLGDTFVFPFREALDPSWATDAAIPDIDQWKDAVDTAAQQGTLANRWYLCWFFLMEVLWLHACLKKVSEHEWLLETDIGNPARQIGVWRRHMQIESFTNGLVPIPEAPPGSTTKDVVCNWAGDGLRFGTRAAGPHRQPWASRIYAYASIPRAFVGPEIDGIDLHMGGTVVTVGEAIRVHTSLLVLHWDVAKLLPKRNFKHETHYRDALKVSARNLGNALAILTGISEPKVTRLLEEATFRGRGRETVWGRPLIFGGGDSRFLFLPAMKSSVLRSANFLIDKYAHDNAKKGVFFQEHARRRIREATSEGLMKSAWVATKPIKSRAGDIDICMFIGGTLFLVEAKYIRFPCDAHEYWRADITIDDAVEQIRRKVAEVKRDPEAFMEQASKAYALPAGGRISDIVPLVLISDTYRAGFPVDDVYVTDLEIVDTFLNNRLIEQQEDIGGHVKVSGRYMFANMADAIAGARQYFSNPPHVAGLKNAMRVRETNYPTDVYVGDKEIRVLLRGPGL